MIKYNGRPISPIWISPLSRRRPGEKPTKPSPESLTAGRLRRRIEALEEVVRFRRQFDDGDW